MTKRRCCALAGLTILVVAILSSPALGSGGKEIVDAPTLVYGSSEGAGGIGLQSEFWRVPVTVGD
ncbi:MAG: hypothetical protein WBR21_23210, partial [Rouxiella badensis]|uniref:hypothetical protein n=1 Tax=Rouxiella badensis TaxID=1646377 RepID=UPI003C504B05